jgi:hypothetical protein
MTGRRLSGAVVCAVAVWSLWTCTATAAGRTRPVVSAAYGVLGARALNVGVRVVGAGSRARVVLESRTPSRAARVRHVKPLRGGRARLRWRVAASLKTVTARVRVIDRRHRTLVVTTWRRLRIPAAAGAPVAAVSAAQVASAPPAGQAGQVALTGVVPVRVGEVLALGLGPQTPYGLLARVTAVTDTPTGTVADTVPATLPEVVPAGDLDVTLTPIALSRPRAALPPVPIARDISCDSGATLDINGGASLSASVKARVKWAFPLSISAAFEANAQASAQLAATVSAQASCTLPSTPLLATPLRLLVLEIQVGPIPVVLVVEGQVNLSASASAQAAIASNANAVISARAGVEYTEDQGFRPFGALTPNFTFTPPTLTATATAQATVTPVVDVLVDGLAGPRVDLNAGVKLSADSTMSPWWTLSAPIDLGAQLRLDAWLVHLASDRFVVYGAEPVLADSDQPEGPPPPPPPPPTRPQTGTCGDRFFKPARGRALIVNDLRARNVSCTTALKIAGANTLGNKLPRGWRCRSSTPANPRTACTRGSARLSYILAGGGE